MGKRLSEEMGEEEDDVRDRRMRDCHGNWKERERERYYHRR